MNCKKCIVLATLALGMMLTLSEGIDFQDKDLESETSLWDLYERWRSVYTVSKSLDEKHKRFNVFKENAKYVHKVNKMDRPYKLKLNQFADMTIDEFRTHYAGSRIRHYQMLQGENRRGSFMYANVSNVPPTIDWRKKGAVTPIKSQGGCGSCWAFSTIASVESINQIKTGTLLSLSEQELVDCDNSVNQGCNGGLMELAFDFIVQNGGITTEEIYPYRGDDGYCDTIPIPKVSIDGHERVPNCSESDLLKAVANQPVSVGIDAANRAMMLYSEGVYTGKCGTRLDHGVAIVGYGATLDGTKYWIVKNSWGDSWGEKGYVRMLRDVPESEGLCGITMAASYPIKNSSDNPGQHSYKDEL